MNQITIQKECIDKVLNSEEFANSSIYTSFLSYLIEAKNQEKDLKESTIAIEFFGKSSDFNPAEDAIVRSHIYNLRKKLETYYLKEGREDKYRITIPKGHYEVTFEEVTGKESDRRNRFQRLLQYRTSILIIFLLGILIAAIGVQNMTLRNDLKRYQMIERSDPIWKEYLTSKLPVLIVVGDHFFFNEDNEDYDYLLAMRDGKVNSLEDLERLKLTHPGKNLRQADEPYFPYHSIWSLPPILSLLYSANQTPIMRRSSSMGPQLLNEYNIIFIGSIKTLYMLKYTLSKSHFDFEISPHIVKYSSPESDSTLLYKTTEHSSGPNEDLVLALKLPGPTDNSIFIIASYHSLGAPEIASYLSNPDTRMELENKFREKFNEIPPYFELLFRVTGIDKTAYNTELLIYDKIVKEGR